MNISGSGFIEKFHNKKFYLTLTIHGPKLTQLTCALVPMCQFQNICDCQRYVELGGPGWWGAGEGESQRQVSGDSGDLSPETLLAS